MKGLKSVNSRVSACTPEVNGKPLSSTALLAIGCAASDVEPAFVGRHVSQIAHLGLTRLGRSRQRGQPVRGDWVLVSAIGRADPIPPFLPAAQTIRVHESGEAVPTEWSPWVCSSVVTRGLP